MSFNKMNASLSIEGRGTEQMYPIIEAAVVLRRSVSYLRKLIFEGNGVHRRLSAVRYRSSIFIPECEIYGYPFIRPGGRTGRELVVHGPDNTPCASCTNGSPCALAQKGADLYPPEDLQIGVGWDNAIQTPD